MSLHPQDYYAAPTAAHTAGPVTRTADPDAGAGDPSADPPPA
ncbi:hypothetical protein [Streptomyces sp. NPDC091649]